MAHIYVLPDGKRANNMKEARTILGIGTHKFRRFVRIGSVIKVEGNSNNTLNVKPLIAQSDEVPNPKN